MQRVAGVIASRSGELFRAYGQFPLVQRFLPLATPEFLPGEPLTSATYRERLPPSWRDYPTLYQSYHRGRLGRGRRRNYLSVRQRGNTPGTQHWAV